MSAHWRFKCPNGHVSWNRRPDNPPERRFDCEACRRFNESPFHAYLIDGRTGDRTTNLSTASHDRRPA